MEEAFVLYYETRRFVFNYLAPFDRFVGSVLSSTTS